MTTLSSKAEFTTLLKVADVSSIQEAAQLLQTSAVVAMPTETVYGLAGVATDEIALTKIFAAKERPYFDPLIVHISSENFSFASLEAAGLITLTSFTSMARNQIEQLAEKFWPGPLTLILPRGPRIPDLVTSGLETVGIRMPAHPIAQALITAAGAPLAAPSANRFGRISPTSAADVWTELSGRIPMILNGGDCAIGVESTVLYLHTDGGATQLRPGAVTENEWKVIAPIKGITPTTKLHSPGQLPSHYAPRKPLTFLKLNLVDLISSSATTSAPWFGKKVGLLTFQMMDAATHIAWQQRYQGPIVAHRLLGADLAQAARQLFRDLRALDEDPQVEAIVTEAVPSNEGLGFAIADRLTRAATRE